MKSGLFPLLLFVFSQITHAQYAFSPWFYFQPGDTLTVAAKSGLNIRAGTSPDAKKIATVPFGQPIVALGMYENMEYEIQDRKGSWFKVKYGKTEGYVFSGFVTDKNIPVLKAEDNGDDHPSWFEKFVRANVDTLVYKGSRLKKGFDEDGKDWEGIDWEVYSDETIINQVGTYERIDLVVETTQISVNDILNLLEHQIELVIAQNKGNDLDLDRLKIVIKKGDDGHIHTIDCPGMEFTAHVFDRKIIITVNLLQV